MFFRVDYIDSFGRTRRCLKKDLPSFQQQDAELNKQPQSTPVSYGNFVKSDEHTANEGDSQNIFSQDEESRKRQRELWEEEEERNRQKTNVHYQDVLYQGRITSFILSNLVENEVFWGENELFWGENELLRRNFTEAILFILNPYPKHLITSYRFKKKTIVET